MVNRHWNREKSHQPDPRLQAAVGAEGKPRTDAFPSARRPVPSLAWPGTRSASLQKPRLKKERPCRALAQETDPASQTSCGSHRGHVGGAFWPNPRQNLPDQRAAAHARRTLPVSLSGQVLIMSPFYRGDRPQQRLGAIPRGQEQSRRTTAGLRALPQHSSSAHKAQLCHLTLSFSHSTDQRQQPGQTQGVSAELTSRRWRLLTLVLCNWVKLSPICCQVSGRGCNSQQQHCSHGKTTPTARRSIFF